MSFFWIEHISPKFNLPQKADSHRVKSFLPKIPHLEINDGVKINTIILNWRCVFMAVKIKRMFPSIISSQHSKPRYWTLGPGVEALWLAWAGLRLNAVIIWKPFDFILMAYLHYYPIFLICHYPSIYCCPTLEQPCLDW